MVEKTQFYEMVFLLWRNKTERLDRERFESHLNCTVQVQIRNIVSTNNFCSRFAILEKINIHSCLFDMKKNLCRHSDWIIDGIYLFELHNMKVVVA